MSAAVVSFRASVLPWAVAADDEVRFRRILQAVLAACVVVCLVLLWMPRPQEDRSRPQELPPRLAKLLLDTRPLPPPAAPLPKADRPATAAGPPPAEVAARPAPAKKQAAKSEVSKEAPVPEARHPQPGKPPGEALEAVRRKAAGVGLLAAANELADLRGAPVAVQLKQDIRQGPGVGAGVGVGVGAGNEAGAPTRALITSNASGGSGGINTAGYSRNTGGGGLAGRATTLVEGVAGGGGGGGPGGGGQGVGRSDGASQGNAGASGGTLQKGGSGKASRSIEDIRLVLERNKGAIYALYNRALRDDPSLQGKVVLELKIAPSGEVLDCSIVSSELQAPELERKLLARIRMIDFGAKDVAQLTTKWPLDFLPS